MRPKKWITAFAGMTMALVLAGCQTVAKAPNAKTESNKEVISALNSVGQSFTIRDSGVKYCPVDGKHFSSRVNICPEHHVKLIPVE